MRRADRAGRHQHLAVAVHLVGLPAFVVFHPHRTLALEQDAPGHGVGDHGQVGPAHGRAQVGVGRGPAHAVLDRHVHGAEAFLHVAVAVVGLDVAGLGAGLDPGAIQRVLHVVAVVGGQRAVGAAVVVAAELVLLGTLEIRQAVAIAPALGSQAFPLVEVMGMAADVHQAIDRRRATQHLAPRAMQAAAVQVLLGGGLVVPVVLLGVHRQGEGAGHLDQHAAVAAAVFEHQHRGAGILAQPAGQDTTGRPGTDDDVVVFFSHCCSPWHPGPLPRRCVHCAVDSRPSPGERPTHGSTRSGPTRPAGRTARKR